MKLLSVLSVALMACAATLPARPQQVFAVQTPPGLEVTVEPDGFAAWTVRAKNARDVPVKIVWDESTFVDAQGRSFGRLIRGRTRVIDDAKPQPPSVVVPDAYIVEWCIPEGLDSAGPKVTPEGNRDYSGMDPVRKGVGRMLIVFETASGKETWEANLSFDGSQPTPRRRSAPKPSEPAKTDSPVEPTAP
jgi:hypothetical protein